MQLCVVLLVVRLIYNSVINIALCPNKKEMVWYDFFIAVLTNIYKKISMKKHVHVLKTPANQISKFILWCTVPCDDVILT